MIFRNLEIRYESTFAIEATFFPRVKHAGQIIPGVGISLPANQKA